MAFVSITFCDLWLLEKSFGELLEQSVTCVCW
uniref:Uncharacterized protein n=1 Tax=Arundo donax TaxID=35708 RepID=A0A0A8Y2H1_ARUDO